METEATAQNDSITIHDIIAKHQKDSKRTDLWEELTSYLTLKQKHNPVDPSQSQKTDGQIQETITHSSMLSLTEKLTMDMPNKKETKANRCAQKKFQESVNILTLGTSENIE